MTEASPLSNRKARPAVALLLPMRNEAQTIRPCLDSLLRQLNSSRNVNMLCIDGRSTDGTRDIVREYAALDPRIRLIDNPGQTAATALNIGLQHARGEIVIRLDCHGIYPPDYLERCVEFLERSGADVAGGCLRSRPLDETRVGRAVAAALSSFFGVGNSQFRLGGKTQDVDTVPNACYRSTTFERFGWFDERLVRNQDIEFHNRIRRGGGRIAMSSSICFTYFCPSTYCGMARQAFRNGLWNPYTIYLTGHGLGVRHFVPLFAVVAGMALSVAGFAFPLLWAALGGLTVVYLVTALTAARAASRKQGAPFPRTAAAFTVLHVAYGVGSVCGILSAPFRFGLSPRRRDRNIGAT